MNNLYMTLINISVCIGQLSIHNVQAAPLFNTYIRRLYCCLMISTGTVFELRSCVNCYVKFTVHKQRLKLA